MAPAQCLLQVQQILKRNSMMGHLNSETEEARWTSRKPPSAGASNAPEQERPISTMGTSTHEFTRYVGTAHERKPEEAVNHVRPGLQNLSTVP